MSHHSDGEMIRRTLREQEIEDALGRKPEKREQYVESYLSDQVRAAGGSSYKLSPTTQGMPDRMVLMPGGRIYLVELKRPKGGVLSPGQKVWHRRAWERTQVKVWVLWTRNQVDDFMARLVFQNQGTDWLCACIGPQHIETCPEWDGPCL